MMDALEEHQGTVSIGGTTMTNLHFADDIDGLAGSEQELKNLIRHLDRSFMAYGIEISANKTKLIANSDNRIQHEILPMEKSLKL